MSDGPFRIVFVAFDGMTQLDLTGPHQFLSRLPGGEVLIASFAGGAVRSEGLVFAETLRLADIPMCDMICVPGGVCATEVALDENVLREIRRLAVDATYITSVCTGSLILGAAGLLIGKRAACHWAWRHLLPAFGAIPDEGRVVRDGRIITGGGVTAGVDFALVVLAEIAGPAVAQTIQLGLEYAPMPPFDSGRPELAPLDVLSNYRRATAKILTTRELQAQEAARRLGLT